MADEIRSDRIKDAATAEQWENLDEATISKEVYAVNSRITALGFQFDKMIKDLEFDKTEQMTKAVMAKDLGKDGWVDSFLEINRSSFPDMAPSKDVPGWVNSLSAGERKQYDMCLAFQQDAIWVSSRQGIRAEVLKKIDLHNLYLLAVIKDNFEKAGYNRAFYDKIDKELWEADLLFSLDWSQLNKRASRSQAYFDRNNGKISPKVLKEGYEKERVKDYRDILKTFSINDSLTYIGNGKFRLKPRVSAKVDVIDIYTNILANMNVYKGKLVDYVNDVKKALNEYPNIDKMVRTEAFRGLMAALSFMLEQLLRLTEASLEIYEGFSGSDLAPYCYMKKLPSLSTLTAKMDFNPPKPEPWDNGTRMVDMYNAIVKTINDQCYLFTYVYGLVD